MLLRHEGHRPTRIIWWAVSLIVVAVGIVLLIMGLRGPKIGPTIPGPIGKTSMPASAAYHVASFSQASSQGDTPVTLDADTSVSSNAQGSIATVTAADSTAAPSSSTTKHSVPTPRVSAADSRPVHLTIPAIGVNTRLEELGLNSNGTVEVPNSWYVAGWYKYGPIPGQLGSSVILGHVDSVDGPAVFYRLADLRPGNLVKVTLATKMVVTFKVIGLREYNKTDFPDKLVYGKRSYDALQLVTCGGGFDEQTHHYLENTVVFTKRVS